MNTLQITWIDALINVGVHPEDAERAATILIKQTRTTDEQQFITDLNVELTNAISVPPRSVYKRIHTFERPILSDGQRAYRVDASKDYDLERAAFNARYPHNVCLGDIHSEFRFYARQAA